LEESWIGKTLEMKFLAENLQTELILLSQMKMQIMCHLTTLILEKMSSLKFLKMLISQ